MKVINKEVASLETTQTEDDRQLFQKEIGAPASASFWEKSEASPRGSHLCLFYENQKEWISGITPFLHSALSNNQKCIYVAHSHSQDEITSALSCNEYDLSKFIARKQFQILHASDTYIPGNKFDPDVIIGAAVQNIEQSLREGYSGLMIAAEAGWALLPDGSHRDRLLEYEARINRELFSAYPLTGICQYDMAMFEPATLKEILKIHPQVIYKGRVLDNCCYIPPDNYLTKEKSRHEVKNVLKNLEDHALNQRKLLESEYYYRTIFEASGTAMCILDDKGIFTAINQHWVEKAGYTKEEAERKMHFSQLIHPDDVKSVRTYFDARTCPGKSAPVHYEVRVVSKNGNIMDTVINTRMLPESKLRVVSILDITDLKESEDRYKALVELGVESGECILALQDIDNQEGIITFVSENFL
ncbi:MAG: MEDS domain-containing protein, partial [Dehalococcoidales bacterium]|nr:MEDS domain-containing protein [Dehalococcoidales bacterium]